MNSTYLESVDKWFGLRGTLTMAAMVSIAICIYGIVFIGFGTGPILWEDMSSDEKLENIVFAGGILLVSCPPLAISLWFLRKESFAYTHYPIRFNRKTRMVHAFRTDGTILSVPWSKVFFTLSQVDHFYRYWNVLGHVICDEKNVVRESFSLSISDVGNSDGVLVLKSHWEFIRRYMEHGPAEIEGQVQFCLPISEKRESFIFGVHRLLGNNSGTPLLMWPVMLTSMVFDLATAPFRYFAMRTSKIPKWPEEVEATCVVEPDDPYAIVGAPNGDRVAVFPEAALAAGVGFRAPPRSPLEDRTENLETAGRKAPVPQSVAKSKNKKRRV